MGDAAQISLNRIPSFLGLPVGDLEDLVPDQVAIAGYFCDNLDRPAPGQRYLARQLRYAYQSGNAPGSASGSAPENTPMNAIDLGDVNVFPLEPDKHFAAVTSQCESVLETGARLVLVGGDSSGLKALGKAVRKIKGTDVPVVSITEGITSNQSETEAVILSVDLQQLAAIWVSQPHRLTGLSPAQMIAHINTTPGNIVAAAVFGLAPALDSRGSTETQAAVAILKAITMRLNKGAL
ncbi:MAG: arginase family enzyme [Candidatus Azotimanducaceae bacterium]|jgi:arginase family enzyme